MSDFLETCEEGQVNLIDNVNVDENKDIQAGPLARNEHHLQSILNLLFNLTDFSIRDDHLVEYYLEPLM